MEREETIEIPRIVKENVQIESMGLIKVSLRATATADICEVHCHIQTRVSYVCSRCLQVFEQPLQTDFVELFSLRAVSDEDVHVVEDDEVDFTPFVEQTLNLALDTTPLCREDCLGLCEQCGANLNETTCSCSSHQVDPRLEALRGLLSEDNSE